MKRQLLCIALWLGVQACAPAVVNNRPQMPSQEGWAMVPYVKPVIQKERKDCGVAATQMVAAHWKKTVRMVPEIGTNGVRAGQMKHALEASGLVAFVIAGTFVDLQNEIASGRPVITGLVLDKDKRRYGHFVVVVGTSPRTSRLMIVDPQRGYVVQSYSDFAPGWTKAGNVALVVSQ